MAELTAPNITAAAMFPSPDLPCVVENHLQCEGRPQVLVNEREV